MPTLTRPSPPPAQADTPDPALARFLASVEALAAAEGLPPGFDPTADAAAVTAGALAAATWAASGFPYGS